MSWYAIAAPPSSSLKPFLRNLPLIWRNSANEQFYLEKPPGFRGRALNDWISFASEAGHKLAALVLNPVESLLRPGEIDCENGQAKRNHPEAHDGQKSEYACNQQDDPDWSSHQPPSWASQCLQQP
jgi:hypothetical protein